MIYKFRMISSEDKAFLRDYEVDSNDTFLDFHTFIQKNLNYDPHLLASFFLTDEHWNKGMELTLIDMENDAGPAAIPMETVKINDLIKHKKERLLYVFDIFSDRAFFIELFDIHPPETNKKYPLCKAVIGEPPIQTEIEDIKFTSTTFDEDLLDEISNDIGFDEDFDSDSFHEGDYIDE